MKLNKNNYHVIFLAILSIIICIFIYRYINFLFIQKYIIECFNSNEAIYVDTGSPTTTHTVNLPLTTTYSCKNFCGPTARCAITGEQCMADIDCPGCNPYGPDFKPQKTACIPGDNDAGKLTLGVTPTYSTLTTDIGTRSKLFTTNKKKLSKPDQPNFGINTWIKGFNGGQQLFDEKYRPAGLQFMPNYDKRYSLSGEFIEDGPLASNAYLH
jgi:hypothetical protein|uniref:Uncharacterized protein n=1 Tax=viral metagenome TaxID=1070528 RepID=A0A6C0DGF1_9ZZZZ